MLVGKLWDLEYVVWFTESLEFTVINQDGVGLIPSGFQLRASLRGFTAFILRR